MMSTTRWARAAAGLATLGGLLLVAWSSPSSGQTCGADVHRCGHGIVTPSRELEVRAGEIVPGGGSRPVPTRSSSYLDGCAIEALPAGEELNFRNDVTSVNLVGVTFDEDYWVIYCFPGALGDYAFYPDGDPPPPFVISDMIADAYERVPVLAFNPITSPDGDADIPLITQMTTYLWVDETEWNTPVRATAVVPGFSVTAEAIPRTATWSGGDEPVTCDGDDMVPYVFGIGGDDAQPSTCTMVYRRSSDLQDNIVELEVVWDARFTCSIPICGGPLPDIRVTSTRPVLVGEIQSVVVNGGG